MNSQKNTTKLQACLLVFPVLLSMACGGAEPQRAEDEAIGVDTPAVMEKTAVVCSNGSVPAGYVITKITSSATCSPYFTYTINLPSAGIVMCSVPPVTYPSGWVVTEILSTSNCSAGGLGNPSYWGRRLYQPFAGIVVCSSSPTPAGWVRTTRVSTGQCNGEWGWVLQPL